MKNMVLYGLIITVCACRSTKTQEELLSPVRSIESIRIRDIDKAINDDPVYAIHLIGIYEELYGADGESRQIRQKAVTAIQHVQKQAIEDRRFEEAASLARSLAVLGVNVSETGQEQTIVLDEAKQYAEQKAYLRAFLAAVRAHELQPLEEDEALFFLDKAYEARQRGSASFFFSLIRNTNRVSESVRNFARGTDSTAAMIEGVATVIVDRGYQIQSGQGTPDRILGSAFFVDPSGLLITNYHVIESDVNPQYEGYSRIYVRVGDSTNARVPAKVIGWDETLDLALIQAQITPAYTFSVIDWAKPHVGDSIYTIGSPVGLEKTVTQGIVSALGRRFLPIGTVIQIDAAVNHGNSGGPVIDREGRLVGVVFAGADTYQGLNFAVSAESLAAALPALVNGGKAERPWLGLTLHETSRGAEIIYTAPFTPASDMRIPEGTSIVSLNGESLSALPGTFIPTLQELLFPLKAGELVTLELSDGKTRILQTVSRPSVPLAEAAKRDSRERIAAPLFGLILSPVSSNQFSKSYFISQVVRGSIADEAGLSAQDPITIRNFKVLEKEGYALLDISVKKRRTGYIEMNMQLPAALNSPDTL
ncbi:hypothetical protein PilKf_00326 [Pillotina sp. SPG140]|jgi:S1-C subfamily serine protease